MSDETTLTDRLRQKDDFKVVDDNGRRIVMMTEAERREEAADRIAELEARVKQVVTELDGEHRPQWVGDVGYTENPVEGREPVGCVMCYPHDSDWPCNSRMIADDLRGGHR